MTTKPTPLEPTDAMLAAAEVKGMKSPKYAAVTMQKMHDAGINPFAAQLLAESHADKPDKFGDETIMLVARAHNDTPVFMLLSTRQPTVEQFASWPGSEAAPDAPDDTARLRERVARLEAALRLVAYPKDYGSDQRQIDNLRTLTRAVLQETPDAT